MKRRGAFARSLSKPRLAISERAPRLVSVALLIFIALVSVTSPALAQLSVNGLSARYPDVAEALQRFSARGTLVSVGSDVRAAGELRSVRVSSRLFALPTRALGALPTSMTSAADAPQLYWSAPRRLLLDQTTRWVRREQYVEQFESLGAPSTTGRGVLIGIADSGLDLEHLDLRNPDGSTRVEWLLDFASPPLGIHADLEAEYGCDGDVEFACGILSAAEIDMLLDGGNLSSAAGNRVELSTDRLGHGTHVASIAAGNGASNPNYAGLAPEAGLIIAKIASTETSVTDAGVLMATRFIYDRADAAGKPVVVNLSLGGDFGPHDGSSVIAQALEEMVEPPGHAMVVAAGNSGALQSARSSTYPGPLGIHNDVAVIGDAGVRVPLLFPQLSVSLQGTVLIWVGTPAGDSISVGIEAAGGEELIEPIDPGYAAREQRSDIEAIIINRLDADDIAEFEDLSQGAAVLLSGEFASGKVLALRLTGNGTASIWVQSEGQLGPAWGSDGVLLPAATRSGTITIPATSPALIAVGATVNRTSWPSRADGTATLVDLGAGLEPRNTAFFSSHGPSTGGWMKPDILAPGVALVAAMSEAADPIQGGRLNPLSIFSDSGICPESAECAVVSDEYAVTLGTSMSSPVVAGAVALLLEQDPTLTQVELRRLLQAGSQRLPDEFSQSSQAEPGLLDLEASARSLALERGEVEAERPSSRHSWLGVSDELARPDPEWPVELRLHLRDAQGQLSAADGSDIELELANGTVLEPPKQTMPGLIEARVAAKAGSAGRYLQIRFSHQGRQLVERRVPIALDQNVLTRGLSIRGGCGVAATSGGLANWWIIVASALLLRRARRQRTSAK